MTLVSHLASEECARLLSLCSMLILGGAAVIQALTSKLRQEAAGAVHCAKNTSQPGVTLVQPPLTSVHCLLQT